MDRRRRSAQRARATREVILAAGALQSPQLLQLSGIGPAALLRRHGIAVVADLPGVGENLQDHYQARTIVRLRERRSLNDDVRNPLRLAAMGSQWLFGRSGPLTVGAGQVGGAACTPARARRPPRRPVQRDAAVGRQARRAAAPLLRLHRVGVAVPSGVARHASRSRATDPLQPPRIEPRYLPRPTSTAARSSPACGCCARSIAQPAFRDLVDGEVLPGARAQRRRARCSTSRASRAAPCSIASAPAGWATTTTPSSIRSCACAASSGLRVIDASVMPTVTSANTNAASLMIGERGARLILGEVAPAASVTGVARERPRDVLAHERRRIVRARAAARRRPRRGVGALPSPTARLRSQRS